MATTLNTGNSVVVPANVGGKLCIPQFHHGALWVVDFVGMLLDLTTSFHVFLLRLAPKTDHAAKLKISQKFIFASLLWPTTRIIEPLMRFPFPSLKLGLLLMYI